MTRRQRRPAGKKKSGMLIGMRSGVKKMAGKVAGGDDGAAEPAKRARWVGIFWNVLTGVLLVAAGAMFLRRCGVIHF